jgi:hypothetical protein
LRWQAEWFRAAGVYDLVDLGDEPTVDDVKRFLAAFPGEERWP